MAVVETELDLLCVPEGTQLFMPFVKHLRGALIIHEGLGHCASALIGCVLALCFNGCCFSIDCVLTFRGEISVMPCKGVP